MEKLLIVIIRIFVILFALRVGVTAIQDMSLFLFIISVVLFLAYFAVPNFVRSVK